MDEETQDKFNHALFWKAKQQQKFLLNPENKVTELLARYRNLTLQDRLDLVAEYEEFLNQPQPTIIRNTNPFRLPFSITKFFKK